MSGSGQTLPWQPFFPTAATPPKPDMDRRGGGRQKRPGTDMAALFDHLVGAAEQRGRYFEPEYQSALHVDDQLELCRLHDRHVRRFSALEDEADIDADLMKGVEEV